MAENVDEKPFELNELPESPTATTTKRMRTPRRTHRYQWRPRFWSSVPWVAVSFCYISLLICIMTAIFLYRWVNNVAVSNWPFPKAQPSTIVSLMSTAGNYSLQVALIDAVAVYFWKRAFRRFPLSNIHYYWRSVQGTYGAARCFLKITGFAILSIITHASTIARDPLFQNSIRISEKLYHRNGTISIPVASNLDTYFAGMMTGRAQNVMITGNFSQILTDYQQRNPILLNNDCLNCTFSVEAFGFNTTCTTATTPYNVTSYATTGDKIFETMSLMTVDVNPVTDDSSQNGYLNVTITRRPSLDCEGDMVIDTCYLTPATMKYTLQTDDGVVSFRNSSWRADSFVSNSSLINPSAGTDGNLAAFLDFGYTLFTTNASLYFSGARGWDYSHRGMLAGTYIIPPSATATCGPAFKDPMDGIINAFRELSLRTSMKQANLTATEVQFVDYTSFAQQAVYVIDYRWVIGAVLVSLAGFTAVGVCLWGFWNVGRPVSFSPLELVKHFSYVGEMHLRHFAPAKGADHIAYAKGDTLIVQWAVDKDNDCELTFVESKPPVEDLRKGDFYNVAGEYED